MANPDQFTNVLNQFVHRSAYTPGQLGRLTSLPKTTIVNWLQGRVKRPRSWQAVVELAKAMRLTEVETDTLLVAAQQPVVSECQNLAKTEAEAQLLAFWSPNTTSQNRKSIPFQAIPLPPYFVGREDELAALRAVLTGSAQTAVCILHGMAGVGKTSLATALAYRLKAHFSDGVLWARLDSSDTMSILATFAQAYGQDVSQYHDVASRSRVVRDLLVDKQAMIVLDNAQTSAQIEPLLPPTGRCAVLVTTRQHNLAALAGARRFEIRPFAPNQATSLLLFAQLLGEERVQAERAELTHIATALGHLPLALTIVASRLAYESGWQTSHFEQRLHHVHQKLLALEFEAQSVRRSFLLSYELLSPDDQQLFATLGRLGKQDFSIELVVALTRQSRDRVEDSLRALYSLSLIQGGINGRYQLHPLLHDFACSIDPGSNLQIRLVQFAVTFTAEHRYDFGQIASEFGHLALGVETAVSQQQFPDLWHLLNQLTPFLLARGMHVQARAWLTQAQALLHAQNDRVGQSWMLLRLGQLERQQQRLDSAENWIRMSLTLTPAEDFPAQIATAFTELGIIYNCRGEYEQGTNYLQQALPLAQSLPSAECFPELLEELGVLTLLAGKYDEARHYYGQGLTVAEDQNRQTQVVMCLKGLGALHYLAQEHNDALRLFTQGYELAHTLGFRKGGMLLGHNLGVVSCFMGSRERADELLSAAQDEAEWLNDFQALGMILDNLARLSIQNDRFSQAKGYFSQRLALATAQGWSDMAQESELALQRLQTESKTAVVAAFAHLKVFI